MLNFESTILVLESGNFQITEGGYDMGAACILWKHPSDSSKIASSSGTHLFRSTKESLS